MSWFRSSLSHAAVATQETSSNNSSINNEMTDEKRNSIEKFEVFHDVGDRVKKSKSNRREIDIPEKNRF
jgi:ribosomal protein L18E